MDRIINMVVNMFIRKVMSKVMSKGMDAGINMVARKRGGGADQPDVADAQAAKRAKDMMKVTRRVSNFRIPARRGNAC